MRIPMYRVCLAALLVVRAAGAEPSGVLSLGDARDAALRAHPDLAVLQAEIDARAAAITQAAARPNPELVLEAENVGAENEAELTLQLDQPIELGGKRSARVGVAEQSRTLADWDLEARRLDVLRDTTRAFVLLLAAQERVTLDHESRELAIDVERTSAERLNAGIAPDAERLRARAARSTAEIELARGQVALEEGRRRLAAQWGAPEAHFERAEGALDAGPAPEPLDRLQARVAGNPDVARFDAEIAEREARLRLERARAIPDVRIGPGVRWRAGPDDAVLVFGASVPLPLFDRNRGAIGEAARRVEQARAERRAAELRVATDLAIAHATLGRARAEVETLRDETLPAVEASFRAVREGYLRGRFGYLEVLDAQRVRFATKSQYLDALAESLASAAAVERLTASSTPAP